MATEKQAKRSREVRIGEVFRDFLINSTVGVCITDIDGRIQEANPVFCRITGYSADELRNKPLSDIEGKNAPDSIMRHREEIITSGETRFVIAVRRPDNSTTSMEINVSSFGLDGRPFWLVFLGEFTELTEIEDRTAIINSLLNLFLRTHSRDEFLKESFKIIQDWAGTSHGGIRVADSQGNIPFVAYTGFSEEFIKSEKWLSTRKDQCACVRVITGKMESQDSSELTQAGSFCCNNTLDFLNKLTPEEKTRFRGLCIQYGYQSLAVIPIRYGQEILGAIHLADEREGLFTPKKIEFLETAIASLIGEGVRRFSIEEQLKRNLETQTVLTSLLHQSLEEHTLDEILGLALDLIHSIRLFKNARSCIFLVENVPDIMNMRVARGFSGNDGDHRLQVKFGEYICGRTALTQKAQFTAHCDGTGHAGPDPGGPHSHYCLPIQYNKVLVGVINVYLEDGHHYDPQEEEILSSFAITLAGVIWRKRSEDQLRTLSRRLVSVQEEERRSIALELHDQIGQMLTGLKLMITQVVRTPAKSQAPILEDTQTALSDLIGKVREMSLNLRPSMLDDLGLLPALIWHFQQCKLRSNLEVDFRHSGLERHFPKDVSIAAYRIIQEALTNIMRYAGVDRVVVEIMADDNYLHIRIEDKGKGFKPTEVSISKTVGLQGMRERAMLLGGSLTIDSRPGEGTTITAELPLSEESDE